MSDTYHTGRNKCFKCKEGYYTSYYKGEKSAWSMPETDTVKCNKCGHICSSWLHDGDLVVDERAVVQEALPFTLKDCDGPINNAIEKFKHIKKLAETYFHIFVDENDDDEMAFFGYRLETNEERAERRLRAISGKIDAEKKTLVEKQKRYQRYLELKEKFNV